MAKTIAIIGAGYTGLSAATELKLNGFDVEVFESTGKAGGLAKGIQICDHDWPLEPFYHHWFNKERAISDLANVHGLQDIIKTYTPNTSFLINSKIKPFDKAQHILSYPGLSISDRYKLGKSLAFLRVTKKWRALEKVTAEKWLLENMGRNVYEKIWQPMLIGKWGNYYNRINMAWFWARIYVRTKKLMYPNGGFQTFTDKIVEKLETMDVRFHFNQEIKSIVNDDDNVIIETEVGKKHFDIVLLTVGPKILLNLVKKLPSDYENNLKKHCTVGAICALFVLKKPIMEKTYWLNIPAKNTDLLNNELPFLVFVEHTNMISPKHYSGNHIVYCGNYFNHDDKLFENDDIYFKELYFSGIKKVFSDITKKNILKSIIHRTEYASPVFFTNHSAQVPKFETPHKNIFWASMGHVYPWDRGTNYAVDIGKKVTKNILNKININE